MEIELALQKKRDVEARIRQLIEEYVESTGLVVEGLEFDRINATAVGDDREVFLYAVSVKAGLP